MAWSEFLVGSIKSESGSGDNFRVKQVRAVQTSDTTKYPKQFHKQWLIELIKNVTLVIELIK